MKLFAHVYLDTLNPPKQIMLQFHSGNWEQRAYWGENKIAWGKEGTASRRRMGERDGLRADLLPDGDVLVVYYAGSEEAMDVCWARLRAG